MFNYPVKLRRDIQGMYLVTCRDLPEVGSGGTTEKQTLDKTVNSIVAIISGYIESRRPVPVASAPEKQERLVILPVLVVAKTALWNTMIETGTRKTDLARLLSVHLPQIDRLIDLQHSSKIESIEAALGHLGRKLVLDAYREK